MIADMSVNHVERLVLRCGWTVERKRHDYGLDLYRETYNARGEVQNGWVWFQLKATDFFEALGGRHSHYPSLGMAGFVILVK